MSNVDSLQADDCSGAQALYGAPATTQDPDTLRTDTRLTSGQSLVSQNLRYRLLYQADGNLVLYDDVQRAPLWASNSGSPAGGAVMQGDGNFVVYDAQGLPRWASGTSGHAGARLVVQNDGNVVIYRPDGLAVWDRHRPIGSGPMPTPMPTPGGVFLTGIVSAENGARIPGASVRILDGMNTGRFAVTNMLGEYRIDGLVSANANLSATAPGYAEHRAGVFIDGINTLSFTLRSTQPSSQTGTGRYQDDAEVSQGVRSPFVVHGPRPFHPAFGWSMRPSKPFA